MRRAATMARRFIDIGANLTDPMYRGIYNGKEKHAGDLDAVLERAWSAGLERILVTGGSLKDSEEAVEFAKRDDRLFATVGCHPTRCGEFAESGDPDLYLQGLLSLIEANRGKVVAVGEIGLDCDRTKFCPMDVQKRFFEKQLELAEKTGLPLFLHCRGAAKDLCEILSRHKDKLGKGVVHSFDGTPEEAAEIVEQGWHIGLNGCSLKTEENLKTVASIPVESIMLETDAPWCGVRKTHAGYKFVASHVLAKKKEKFELGLQVDGRNEPANIVQVSEIVAGVKNINLDEFCQRVLLNTKSVFFPDSHF